jgi:predicted O-methyltransferase YrrM
MKKLMLIVLHLLLVSSIQADEQWNKCKQKVVHFLPSIQGWCSPEKATRMMDLIYKTHPEVCVEVGVYGGSSVFPTATALKYLNQGVIYAIDPWRNEDCLVGYKPGDPNYNWWNKIDLEEIYRGFLHILKRHKLTDYCEVVRMTGAEAVSHFDDESIDILHIDGNHSEESALHDAQAYLPKVKKGGYIWFDDANWSSTKKAVSYLLDHCELSPSSKLSDPYLLFQKK